MQLAKGTRTPTSLRTAKLVVYPRSSFFPPLLLDISPVHSTATFNSSSYEFFVSYFFFFFLNTNRIFGEPARQDSKFPSSLLSPLKGRLWLLVNIWLRVLSNVWDQGDAWKYYSEILLRNRWRDAISRGTSHCWGFTRSNVNRVE